jgi:hypothetical protein
MEESRMCLFGAGFSGGWMNLRISIFGDFVYYITIMPPMLFEREMMNRGELLSHIWCSLENPMPCYICSV